METKTHTNPDGSTVQVGADAGVSPLAASRSTKRSTFNPRTKTDDHR